MINKENKLDQRSIELNKLGKIINQETIEANGLDSNTNDLIPSPHSSKHKVHICPFSNCGFAFNRPYKLYQHLLIHQNVRAFMCGEPGCDKAYTTKSHLDRHTNTAHKPPEESAIFICPQCLRNYSNRQNLKRHLRSVHSTVKPVFQCDYCNMKFRKKTQLGSHMYHHTGIKSFYCDLCDLSFVTDYERNKHRKNHKEYKCDLCFMVFMSHSKFVEHRRKEHYSEFICENCNKNFLSRDAIVKHMKIHEEPPASQNLSLVFACPYDKCQRQYTRRSNLKQHILMRHEKVAYPCELCPVKLSTKATLQRHMKIHERTEPLPPRQYKTKATGRKERSDKGHIKTSTKLRILGLASEPENFVGCPTQLVQVQINSD